MSFAFFRRLALTLSFALAVVSVQSPARADAVDDALALFTTDSFNDTTKAIEGLVASGNANTLPILRALADGKLLYDPASKAVFYKDDAGSLLDAKTAAPASADTSSLKAVRLNNRLRRAVEAARGGLALLAPEPERRRTAAEAVFKSRDANALPTLDAAIEKETDARAKAAMELARAAIVVTFPGAS